MTSENTVVQLNSNYKLDKYGVRPYYKGEDKPINLLELELYLIYHNINKKTCNIYINKDSDYATAIGVYKDKDTGHWIVYKNEMDGCSVIKYKGYSEEIATDILYSIINDMVEKYNYMMAHRENSLSNSPDKYKPVDDKVEAKKTNINQYKFIILASALLIILLGAIFIKISL